MFVKQLKIKLIIYQKRNNLIFKFNLSSTVIFSISYYFTICIMYFNFEICLFILIYIKEEQYVLIMLNKYVLDFYY